MLFHVYGHLLVTGVGGLITMRDEDDGKLLRSLMQHGRESIYLSIDDDDDANAALLAALVERRFSFVRMGWSYRITELERALGLAALAEADDMLVARTRNGARLTHQLRDLGDVLQLPNVPPDREHAFMMFPIIVRDNRRNKFALHIERSGIETRLMMPLVNQPYYVRQFGDISAQYPRAQYINDHGLYIGCHQGMTNEDIDYVAETIHDFFLRS